jgi:peptidoglycan/xylan/chitin deacetylase (PgdA/CDA1 family)
LKNFIKKILNRIFSYRKTLSSRIIYYHSVDFNQELAHDPAQFEKQIKWLKQEGFRFVLVSEILDIDPGEKVIALTFDDGYEDNFRVVLPILLRLGVSATFYLSTKFIAYGENTSSETGNKLYPNRRMMCATQIRSLLDAGMEIGSHGHSHELLGKMSFEDQRRELDESIRVLKNMFNVDVKSFSYPNGQRGAFSSEFNRYVLRNTDLLVLTTLWQTLGTVRIQGRCEMAAEDSFSEFISKIHGRRDYRFILDRLLKKSNAWL